MAKSAAPFMSINPSGSIAGLLTASRWKGRPYLRLLVTPSNPRTNAQGNARAILGSIAKAAKSVLTSYVDGVGVGSPFFIAARDQAPSGQSWISFLQKSGASDFGPAMTAWQALSGTISGYFENTADDIGLLDYTFPFPETVYYASTPGAQLFYLAYFASHELTGDVKTAADLAIAGASQGNVDDFGQVVHQTA